MSKLTLSDLASLTNEQSAIAAINANSALIETALENTLSRDGTSPNAMGADLDMDSNRILNLPDALNAQEPVTLSQFEAGVGSTGAAPATLQYVVMQATSGLSAERVLTGTANEITLTDGGANGNATLSLPSALTFTGKTVTNGTFNSPSISNPTLSGTSSFGSGYIFNWNSSDVTLTHSANTLTFAGASSGYFFDATISNSSTSPLTFTGSSATIAVNSGSGNNNLTFKTRGSGSVSFLNELNQTYFQMSPVAASGIENYIQFVGNSSGQSPYISSQGTIDANVGLTFLMKGSSSTFILGINSVGNILTGTNTQVSVIPTTTSTSSTTGSLKVAGGAGIAENLNVGGTSKFTGTVSPTSNDGAALGTTALMWSDLFLASGAVINFNNGDCLLTHSSDLLSFTGGDVSFDGNSVILTERAAPSAPAADSLKIYCKDVAGVSHLFTQNSTGTETDLNAASVGTALVLISSATVSGAAQQDFLASLDDTYDEYKILYEYTVSTDDVSMDMQVITGASTVQTSNYNYANFAKNTSGDVSTTATAAAQILMTSNTGTAKVGNAAGENVQGEITFSNPESTSNQKLFNYRSAYIAANGLYTMSTGGGCWTTTATAVTGIRLKPNSGNITGRASLYGIKKA